MTNIQILGLKETKAFLKRKKSNTVRQIKLGMGKAAILVQGNVKKSIAGQAAEPKSVDTGRFLNSIEIDVQVDNAAIFSNLPYANILEEGASNRIARNHFKNSAARSKAGVRDILNASIKNI